MPWLLTFIQGPLDRPAGTTFSVGMHQPGMRPKPGVACQVKVARRYHSLFDAEAAS